MTAAAPQGGNGCLGGGTFLEQETKKRPWHGLLGPAAGAAALGLLLTMALTGDRARAAAATAALELSRPEAVAAAAQAELGDTVIPLGRAVGIKLFSDGVLVVGLSSLDTPEGPASPGRTSGLKAGDVITHMDGSEVDTIEEVQDHLAQHPGEKMTLQVQRGEESLQLAAQAVKTTAGSYQLGVWLRDSMAGIGTMTFYDPDSGAFGALGHGITDTDTALLMPFASGSILPSTVKAVKKGAVGDAGELRGDFDLSRDLGDLSANTASGIFGTLDPGEFTERLGEPMPVAAAAEVHAGPATILSNVEGDSVEEYDIEILQVVENSTDGRDLVISVTDPELLSATGGIVQGMSGSPILQDGKFAGAVTHVLLNDPSKGYGILMETMLEAGENTA